jgi:hypothetical protein
MYMKTKGWPSAGGNDAGMCMKKRHLDAESGNTVENKGDSF